jgi:hypothetical protein
MTLNCLRTPGLPGGSSVGVRPMGTRGAVVGTPQNRRPRCGGRTIGAGRARTRTAREGYRRRRAWRRRAHAESPSGRPPLVAAGGGGPAVAGAIERRDARRDGDPIRAPRGRRGCDAKPPRPWPAVKGHGRAPAEGAVRADDKRPACGPESTGHGPRRPKATSRADDETPRPGRTTKRPVPGGRRNAPSRADDETPRPGRTTNRPVPGGR